MFCAGHRAFLECEKHPGAESASTSWMLMKHKLFVFVYSWWLFFSEHLDIANYKWWPVHWYGGQHILWQCFQSLSMSTTMNNSKKIAQNKDWALTLTLAPPMGTLGMGESGQTSKSSLTLIRRTHFILEFCGIVNLEGLALTWYTENKKIR